MAFDETDTAARKIEVCQRAYRLWLTKLVLTTILFSFGPNVFAVAAGMKNTIIHAVDLLKRR